jgi:hypothetical protein
MDRQLKLAGNDHPTDLSNKKTQYLAADMRKWRKAQPKLSDQLASVEDQLLQSQFKPPDQQDFNLKAQLTDQYHQLLVKEEEFHHQRAKKNWGLRGDRKLTFTRPLSNILGRTELPTAATRTEYNRRIPSTSRRDSQVPPLGSWQKLWLWLRPSLKL